MDSSTWLRQLRSFTRERAIAPLGSKLRSGEPNPRTNQNATPGE